MGGDVMRKAVKDYRLWICVAMTIGFGCIGGFVLKDSYIRFAQSVVDLGLSIAFYFCELFLIPYSFTPTVSQIPSMGMSDSDSLIIPHDQSMAGTRWSVWWSSLWNSETLSQYAGGMLDGLSGFLRILLIVMPLAIVAMIMFNRWLSVRDDSVPNEESRQLRFWRKWVERPWDICKRWTKGFIGYVSDRKWIWIPWVVIWLLSLNLATIVVESVAFYLYLVMSFDLGNLYTQLVKLFRDLLPIVRFVPWPIWILMGLFLFQRWRKTLAHRRLLGLEKRDRQFISSLGLVVLVCGPTGTGKTATMTDMALSQEAMFRQEALERLIESDMRFPRFPFATLEEKLRRAMEHHQVYSLATCKAFARKLRERFERNPSIERCLGYDYERYGLYKYDGLRNVYLFDMIETYCQLFLIYVTRSSLLVSNYGIRVDGAMEDIGTLPMWDMDFFGRDERTSEAFSRHAHILDMDMLRLGRRVCEYDERNDALEFGCVLISEAGKERGNQLTNQGMKVDDLEANPRNDLTELYMKMARHGATVDNHPFLRILMDEQRPESLGADARELAEKIVYIRGNSDERSALPLFSIDWVVHDALYGFLDGIYRRYRHARSDDTLAMHLLKGISSWIHGWYKRETNEYGFVVVDVETERGTMDGGTDAGRYYRCNKKVFSARYSTDCFSDFFDRRGIRSLMGIGDLPEYETERASLEELSIQRSYFVEKLTSQAFRQDEDDDIS